MKTLGVEMYQWASELFPVPRSLTGNGVRDTLRYLQRIIPNMRIKEIPSGTKVGDWTVPDEWNVREAWVADHTNKKIINFADNTLHLLGYSVSFSGTLSREELEPHLYSLVDQPDAIPYVTSYYERRWGFCLAQKQRDHLGAGPFKVHIDADLSPGSLTYGELVLEGESSEEVLLSTYVCHPSMANNELSGPVVATALARWLSELDERKYTYRILFIPETIGAIAYLSEHLQHLKKHVVAGWVLTCIGDERVHSYVPSRLGDTLADRISRRVLEALPDGFVEYSFLNRGSDERQWCAPGVDLPVCSLMRSKYGEYPEYHTSLDNLDVISPTGLQGGFDVIKRCIETLEKSSFWMATTIGEPQMGKRELYSTLSMKASSASAREILNVLAYCDGQHDYELLKARTGLSETRLMQILETLSRTGLVSVYPPPKTKTLDITASLKIRKT